MTPDDLAPDSAALSRLRVDRGLDAGRINSYLPLVVTLETLPINALLYELIEGEVERRGTLAHPKVRPLQVVDISDLEHVMSGVEQGFDLGDLFHRLLARHCRQRPTTRRHIIGREQPCGCPAVQWA